MKINELIEAYESKLVNLNRSLKSREEVKDYKSCIVIQEKIYAVTEFIENLKEIEL